MSGVNFNVTTQLAGSSGSGGTNYGSSNASDYTVYKDAAAATPADMTATSGTPTVTMTTTTSSPLRGGQSMLFTKTAANEQGEGFSDAFTIDDADKCKVLTISFDYEIASGTYATGDLAVYVYDVTNSTLIQPAGYQIQNTGVESKHIATFQTTTSTSYRWGFHVATTTATAYTMKIDNVQVGPQVVQYGAPVTDWTTYTPTSTFTNTTHTAKWRRVGDSMEIEYYGVCTGTPGAATFDFTIPSGYTIDTAKISLASAGLGNYGSFFAYDSSAGLRTVGVPVYGSTTTLRATIDNQTSSVTQAVPFTFAINDVIYAKVTVPITGWSSSVQMSNDTDTRVVSFKARNAAATSIANGGSGTLIPFATVEKDSHGAFSAGVYTVKVPGDYVIDTSAALDAFAMTAGQNVILFVRKNGTIVSRREHEVEASTTQAVAVSISDLLPNLVAGDTIDVFLYQDSGSARTLIANGTYTYLSLYRLSGPSAIAASETVSFSATNTATAISSSKTAIVWTNEVQDTHGSFDGTSFTAPVSGTYIFQAGLFFTASSTAATDPMQMDFYKNNSTMIYEGLIRASGNATHVMQLVCPPIKLLAGETIRVRASSGATTPSISSSTTVNFFGGYRVGNY